MERQLGLVWAAATDILFDVQRRNRNRWTTTCSGALDFRNLYFLPLRVSQLFGWIGLLMRVAPAPDSLVQTPQIRAVFAFTLW